MKKEFLGQLTINRTQAMENLPVELLLEIMKHLEADEIIQLRQVNKMFYGLTTECSPLMLKLLAHIDETSSMDEQSLYFFTNTDFLTIPMLNILYPMYSQHALESEHKIFYLCDFMVGPSGKWLFEKILTENEFNIDWKCKWLECLLSRCESHISNYGIEDVLRWITLIIETPSVGERHLLLHLENWRMNDLFDNRGRRYCSGMLSDFLSTAWFPEKPAVLKLLNDIFGFFTESSVEYPHPSQNEHWLQCISLKNIPEDQQQEIILYGKLI